MHIIIAGCERVGSYIAHTLFTKGHDLVIIDDSADNLAKIESIDCIKIKAKPIDVEAQRNAGAETADVFLCSSSNENINVMAAEIAQVIFNVPKVIVRTLNPKNDHVIINMGLETVCSTQIQAEYMIAKVFSDFNKNTVKLFDHTVTVKKELLNEAFFGKELRFLEDVLGKRVLAVERSGELLNLSSELILHEGDYILCHVKEEA